MSRKRDDEQNQLLRELNEERAAALFRISRRLEALIAQVRSAGEHVARASGAEREHSIARFQALREEALKYRWYLEVQREALGLREHRMLDEFYRIPSLDLASRANASGPSPTPNP